jgi:hypothetical protein
MLFNFPKPSSSDFLIRGPIFSKIFNLFFKNKFPVTIKKNYKISMQSP